MHASHQCMAFALYSGHTVAHCHDCKGMADIGGRLGCKLEFVVLAALDVFLQERQVEVSRCIQLCVPAFRI